MLGKKEATHTAIKSSDGYRFIFYCDISGARVCTTKEMYEGDTPEAALYTAWQTEGKSKFNKCHKCGNCGKCSDHVWICPDCGEACTDCSEICGTGGKAER